MDAQDRACMYDSAVRLEVAQALGTHGGRACKARGCGAGSKRKVLDRKKWKEDEMGQLAIRAGERGPARLRELPGPASRQAAWHAQRCTAGEAKPEKSPLRLRSPLVEADRTKKERHHRLGRNQRKRRVRTRGGDEGGRTMNNEESKMTQRHFLMERASANYPYDSFRGCSVAMTPQYGTCAGKAVQPQELLVQEREGM